MKHKNITYRKNENNGFTLVELLLYIGLASFILLSISVVLSLILRSQIKNQAIAEVYDQGINVLNIITSHSRNALQINSPATSTNASSLSLRMASSSFNPTIFDLSSGVIRITEGLGVAIPITSSRVVASDIDFYNLSRPNTPGIIKIRFTLSYFNPTGQNEYNITKTFYGSATIRY